MERVKRWKEKVLGSGRYYRIGCYCASGFLLVGCTTIKKAGITSIAAGGGALAGSVLSGGALAPMAGATVTAFAADVVTELKTPQKITQGGDMNCAPDNFWTLLGILIEMGGWALILIVIIPMIFSWLLPGPIKFKGRDKNPGNPYLK